jgi:mono/diheme cytochrome c family protein
MNRIQTLLLVAASALALGVPGRSRPRVIAADGGVAVSHAQDATFAPATITLGEKIFQGKAAGGLCFSCHGPNAKGTKGIAPNLTDATWLHSDGSYPAIVSTIEAGVPKPKEAAAPMPPMGGAHLTTEQVHAVAAYVYSLRAKK